MENVVKVTLSTKRTVQLREMKIKHQNLAIQIAGKKAGENQAYLASLMVQEILKQLIVTIDDKPAEKAKLESLDDLFSYVEFQQLQKVVQKLMGGDDMGEAEIENVLTGG